MGQRASDYTFIQAKVWDNLPLFTADEGYKIAVNELIRVPQPLIMSIRLAAKFEQETPVGDGMKTLVP